MADPVPCATGERVQQIVAAADDRIVMAGDVLQFENFFVPDQQLQYDDKAFQKRLVTPPRAGELINEFNVIIAITPDFTAAPLEIELKNFCETQGIELGDIIHALRVALTGSAAGFGMFDTMAILGRASCISRINRALDKLENVI